MVAWIGEFGRLFHQAPHGKPSPKGPSVLSKLPGIPNVISKGAFTKQSARVCQALQRQLPVWHVPIDTTIPMLTALLVMCSDTSTTGALYHTQRLDRMARRDWSTDSQTYYQFCSDEERWHQNMHPVRVVLSHPVAHVLLLLTNYSKL